MRAERRAEDAAIATERAASADAGHGPRRGRAPSAVTDLRRYRAERAARANFKALQPVVFANVRSALGARARDVPPQQLEADYNFAWNSLMGLLMSGTEIDSLPAWLTTATTRRAQDYLRKPNGRDVELFEDDGAHADDEIARIVEDREAVQHVITTIQHRFGRAEAEILFCLYVLDMRREEVASRLDISVKRLHKILDGHKGRPGLRAELDGYISVIQSGDWCAEHSSLISAYVLGWFSPENPKARQARAHLAACSACRSYANAKRGIAALLPPFTPAMFHSDRVATWLEQFNAGIHSAARTIGEKLGIASTSDAATGAAAAGGGTVAAGGIAGAKLAACLTAVAAGGVACLAAVTIGVPHVGTSQARDTPDTAAQHAPPATTTSALPGLTIVSPLPKVSPSERSTRQARRHTTRRDTNDEFSIEKSTPAPAPAPAPTAPPPTSASTPAPATTTEAAPSSGPREFGFER
jgi:DNA-directed RNA polymerase specialized sigma24 family protein